MFLHINCCIENYFLDVHRNNSLGDKSETSILVLVILIIIATECRAPKWARTVSGCDLAQMTFQRTTTRNQVVRLVSSLFRHIFGSTIVYSLRRGTIYFRWIYFRCFLTIRYFLSLSFRYRKYVSRFRD